MTSSSSCSRLAALAGRMISSLSASSSAASAASASYCSRSSIASAAIAGRATATSPSPFLSIAAGIRSYIRVPVNRNHVDRALRDINRICQADDVVASWRADRVFTRPAIKRVIDRKASERRLASKRFKAHMRWVMARRERGF